MKALNTLKPDIEPFATKTLGEMISMVKTLIEKGYAYESNGDVYFRVKNSLNTDTFQNNRLTNWKAVQGLKLETKKKIR